VSPPSSEGMGGYLVEGIFCSSPGEDGVDTMQDGSCEVEKLFPGGGLDEAHEVIHVYLE